MNLNCMLGRFLQQFKGKKNVPNPLFPLIFSSSSSAVRTVAKHHGPARDGSDRGNGRVVSNFPEPGAMWLGLFPTTDFGPAKNEPGLLCIIHTINKMINKRSQHC
jgi:hypothetical protein